MASQDTRSMNSAAIQQIRGGIRTYNEGSKPWGELIKEYNVKIAVDNTDINNNHYRFNLNKEHIDILNILKKKRTDLLKKYDNPIPDKSHISGSDVYRTVNDSMGTHDPAITIAVEIEKNILIEDIKIINSLLFILISSEITQMGYDKIILPANSHLARDVNPDNVKDKLLAIILIYLDIPPGSHLATEYDDTLDYLLWDYKQGNDLETNLNKLSEQAIDIILPEDELLTPDAIVQQIDGGILPSHLLGDPKIKAAELIKNISLPPAISSRIKQKPVRGTAEVARAEAAKAGRNAAQAARTDRINAAEAAEAARAESAARAEAAERKRVEAAERKRVETAVKGKGKGKGKGAPQAAADERAVLALQAIQSAYSNRDVNGLEEIMAYLRKNPINSTIPEEPKTAQYQQSGPQGNSPVMIDPLIDPANVIIDFASGD